MDPFYGTKVTNNRKREIFFENSILLFFCIKISVKQRKSNKNGKSDSNQIAKITYLLKLLGNKSGRQQKITDKNDIKYRNLFT